MMLIRMRAISLVFFVLITSMAHAQNIHIAYAPKFPQFKETFPKCPDEGDSELRLRRCNQELEEFRKAELEPFGLSIENYSKYVREIDGKLRSNAKKGIIDWKKYEDIKPSILIALQMAEPSAELRVEYNKYYKKYKSRVEYINSEIKRCEVGIRRRCRS